MDNQELWIELKNEAYEKGQTINGNFDWKGLFQKMEKMEEEQKINNAFFEIVPTHEQRNYVRSLIKLKTVKPNICFHYIEELKELEEKAIIKISIHNVNNISFEAKSLTELLKELHFMFIMQPEEMTVDEASLFLFQKAEEGEKAIPLDGIESVENWEIFWRK